MTDTHVVQAWNRKWHIYEQDSGIREAEPVGAYNRVAKPARRQALTGCGLGILVRDERTINHRSDFTLITPRGTERFSMTFCKNCLRIINRRYPRPTTPTTWVET